MFRRRVVVLSFMVAASLVAAQQPGNLAPQASPSPPGDVFRTAIEVVNVDAVVLDQKGKPVEGLTQSDFQIKEDGKPQAISSFEAATLAESPAEPPPGRQAVSTNATPAPRGDRSFVVLFDDANISQYATPRAQKAISDFLQRGLGAGDHVMVVPTLGGAWWTGRMPEDRQELMSFVSRLKGAWRPDTGPGRIWDHEAMGIALGRNPQLQAQVARRYFENDLIPEAQSTDPTLNKELDVSPGLALVVAKARETYTEATTRLRATLSTLDRIAASLHDLRGRKTVFLVSEGFIMDPSQPEFHELVQAARNSNTAVYFVDVRGPAGAVGEAGLPGGGAEFGRAIEERDTTTSLAFQESEGEGARAAALDTGGAVVAGTDIGDEMVNVARSSRAYYLLGYASSNPKRDGKFRKIEVTVSRPDLVVRARRGYYAPSSKDERHGDPNELDPVVRAGLDAPFAAAGLPLRLTSYVLGQPTDGKLETDLVAEADLTPLRLAPTDGKFNAKLDSYVVLHGHDDGSLAHQETLIELALPVPAYEQTRGVVSFRRRFMLAPGRYQARLLVRDRHTGLLGTVRHEFEVPRPDGFRISTPVLTDLFQSPGAAGPPVPVPIAHRGFKPGAQLACAFEVFGAAPDPAAGGPRVSLSYRLRRADGTEVAAAPARLLKARGLGEIAPIILVQLPKDAEGRQELVLTLRDEVSTKSIEVTEPFVVSGPS